MWVTSCLTVAWLAGGRAVACRPRNRPAPAGPRTPDGSPSTGASKSRLPSPPAGGPRRWPASWSSTRSGNACPRRSGRGDRPPWTPRPLVDHAAPSATIAATLGTAPATACCPCTGNVVCSAVVRLVFLKTSKTPASEVIASCRRSNSTGRALTRREDRKSLPRPRVSRPAGATHDAQQPRTPIPSTN